MRFSQLIRRPISVLLVTAPVLLLFCGLALSQETKNEADEEFEKRAKRYWSILVKRPQPGIAFDHCYRHYLDSGRLDDFEKRVQTFASENPDNAGAQCLLGVFLERQTRFQPALVALRKASQLAAPQNHIPHALLGQFHCRQLDFKSAIGPLTAAIKADPPRSEKLSLSKQLARAQLVLGQVDQALKSLDQLAELFPGDTAVLTDIADLLQSEDRFDAAIERWQQVAKLSTEQPQRRVQADVAIAELLLRKGKSEAAKDQLLAVLNRIRPDGWLADDVRGRVDELFLTSGNLEEWLACWQNYVEQYPDNVWARVHLADAQWKNGKTTESLSTLEAAVKLAPTNTELQQALILRLLDQHDYDRAQEEARAFAIQNPQDSDVLFFAGDVFLKQLQANPTAKLKPVRGGEPNMPPTLKANLNAASREATDLWRTIQKIRPDDARLALAIADHCRESLPLESATRFWAPPALLRKSFYSGLVMIDTAEEFYRLAARLAGDQRYEMQQYLAEFLFDVGRVDEALAVADAAIGKQSGDKELWRQHAALMIRFRQKKRAISSLEKSLAVEDSWNTREQLVSALKTTRQHGRILKELPALEKLADTPSRRKSVLQHYVFSIRALGQSEEFIVRLTAENDAAQDTKTYVRNFRLLAMLNAVEGNFDAAVEAMREAVALDSGDELLSEYSVFLERAGNVRAAVDQLKILLRNRPESARRIQLRMIRLLLSAASRSKTSRGGNSPETQEAQSIFKRLIASPSRNPEELESWSALAATLNLSEDALNLLRRAVRLKPEDDELRMSLVRLLLQLRERTEAQNQFRVCISRSQNYSQQQELVELMLEKGKMTRAQRSAFIEQLHRLPLAPSVRSLLIARALNNTNQFQMAVEEMKALLLREPDNETAKDLLADAYSGLGQWKLAITTRERIHSSALTADMLTKLLIDQRQINNHAAILGICGKLVRDFQEINTVSDLLEELLTAEKNGAAQRVLARRVALEVLPAAREIQSTKMLEAVAATLLLTTRDDAYPVFQLVAEMHEQSGAVQRASLAGTTLMPARPGNTARVKSIGSYGYSVEPFQLIVKETLQYLSVRDSLQRSMDRKSAWRQLTNRTPYQQWLVALVAMQSLQRNNADRWIAERTAMRDEYDYFELLCSCDVEPASAEFFAEAIQQFPDEALPRLMLFRHRLDLDLDEQEQPAYGKLVAEAYQWLLDNQPDTAVQLLREYISQMLVVGRTKQLQNDLPQLLSRIHGTPVHLTSFAGNPAGVEWMQLLDHIEETQRDINVPAMPLFLNGFAEYAKKQESVEGEMLIILSHLANLSYDSETAPLIMPLVARELQREQQPSKFPSTERSRKRAPGFPCACDLLDAATVMTLRHMEFPDEWHAAEWLQDNVRPMTDAMQLAIIYIHWEQREKDVAYEKLAKLTASRTGDSRLLMHKALYVDKRYPELLKRIHTDLAGEFPDKLKPQINELRGHVIGMLASSRDPEKLLPVLQSELSSPVEPALGKFFEQSNMSALPRFHYLLNAKELLQEHSEELLTATQDQLRAHPNSVQLRLWCTALLLEAGQMNAAVSTYKKADWDAIPRDSNYWYCYAMALMRHDRTFPFALELAAERLQTYDAEYLPRFQFRLAHLVKYGPDDLTEKLLERLRGDISKLSEKEKLEATARVLRSLPTDMISPFMPFAIQVAQSATDAEQVDSLYVVLALGMDRGLKALTAREHGPALEEMAVMLFPDGPDELPVALSQQNEKRRGALLSIVQRFADAISEYDVLPDWRKKWEQHPKKDHPRMLQLRLHAAERALDYAEMIRLADTVLQQDAAWAKLSEGQPDPASTAIWSASVDCLVRPQKFLEEWLAHQTSIKGIRSYAGSLANNQFALAAAAGSGPVLRGGNRHELNMVFTALRHCKKIRRIQISRLQIRDEHLQLLAGKTELEALSIHSSLLSDASVAHFKTLTGLKTLGIKYNRMSSAGIESLKAALPNCKIETSQPAENATR